MGRPLLTAPFTALITSVEASRESSAEVVGTDAEPRRWCEKDADPDEEAWWSGKEIFVESFIQTTNAPANMENVTSSQNGHHRRSMVALNEDVRADQSTNKLSHVKNHPVAQQSTQPMEIVPRRYTIDEQLLASVQLDAVTSDPEDEFELDWDAGSEFEMDFRADSPTIDSGSEMSSSPPSRGVLRSMTSLPIAVPRTPEYTRSRTLPSCGTPACQNSYHMSPPAIASLTSGSPISARSIPRVRGFAVHSPRTELVL